MVQMMMQGNNGILNASQRYYEASDAISHEKLLSQVNFSNGIRQYNICAINIHRWDFDGAHKLNWNWLTSGKSETNRNVSDAMKSKRMDIDSIFIFDVI